jgi:hypothetical protein
MTHCGEYDATPESLLAAGISYEAVCIIELVTKPAGAVYLDWLASIIAARNIGAIRVKLADNEDNQESVRATMIPGAGPCGRDRLRARAGDPIGGAEPE